MNSCLRIKNKHLVYNARITKKEEARIRNRVRVPFASTYNKQYPELIAELDTLSTHRKFTVRNECRAVFLARMFIKGKSYRSVEPHRKFEKEYYFRAHIIGRVAYLVSEYSDRVVNEIEIQKWVNG